MLNSHSRRPLLAALVVFLLASIAAATLIWHLDQRERQERRARVFNLASARAGSLQRSIEHDLSASYALAALVRQGKGTVPNFDAVASEMLPFYPGVSELALAPGGVVRNIVPLAGNEQAVGYDLLKDEAQKREALLARDTGKLTLAGPLDLVQGGRGVVGRLPVFLDDTQGKPSFWGFALVMMRFPGVLDTVNLPQLAKWDFAYELWRIHPDTGQKQTIAASSNAALIEPVERSLKVPNATWTLSVAPLSGWGHPLEMALEAALGLFFSLLLGYAAKLLLESKDHEKRLEALVAQRTDEVVAREADLTRAQSMARLGSWTFDVARNEFRGSAEFVRICGVSASTPLSYELFLQRVHAQDRESVDRSWQMALKGGEPYDVEYRMVVDAATRWVRSNAELKFAADGTPLSALGTIQDITERKLAEEALRASESRYRELFEANPQPMWVYDLQTLEFLAVNDAAVAHYGYSRDEFLAMIITDITPPEDVPRLLQRVALLQKQNLRGAGTWRHRRKDGTLIDVEIASHTLDFGGRRAQIVLASDVTEQLQAQRKLHESEARYRSVANSAKVAIVTSDAAGRIRGWNPAAERIFGYAEAEVIGKSLKLLMPQRYQDRYLDYMQRVQSGDERGVIGELVELVGRRRDASEFPLEMSLADWTAGERRFFTGIIRDVSERKANEAKIQRLTQLYAALSQCNQAIVRCSSEEELFPQICRVTVQFGGMKAARISLVDPDTRMVRVAAGFGYRSDDLQNLEVSVDADNPYGRGPTGTAMRENRPFWCQDFMNDPLTAPWHERGARMGWGAAAALPLHRNGVVVGAFVLFEGEANAFDESRRELLLEMAADISFALGNFERETQRRRAQEALRESEARFRSLTEMSSDFYWEIDAEHRLTQRSSGSGRNALSELMHNDWLGRRRWDIPYLAPDASGWQAHHAVLDAHLPFRDFEFSRAGADGSKRHFLIHGDPVFDASGVFQGYRGVGTDITERKRAERALAESEARFRSLTEMSSDFYWESDAEHRLVARGSAKRKLSTVSVFQRGAQLGERRWEIPYLTPDAAGWQAHRALLDAHLPFRDFELSRRGTDGSERFISISGEPVFDASGAFQGYRGVGTDITERKQAERALKESERRLRLALNSAAMAAWEWHIGPDTLIWNEHPGWLIGPEPAGGYADFRELVHAEDRAAFLQAGQQAIAQGTHYHAEFRITRTDGIVRWIEAQGVFFDAEGSARGERIIGVSRDITESKHRQDELRRLNEELEQRVAERTQTLEAVNNELEAFSYSVSHDLQAPLRTVQGFSDLLQKQYAGQIDEQGRNMLRRMGSGAETMGLLIDDLLKLSRISRQEMRIEPVELSALAREVAEELQAGARERRVEWIIAPQVSAKGDPGLIRVVLQNLIGNAWKYSSRREVARIEFGVGERGGRPVYFVRDNGAGFDMAYAKKLFGAFQRLHSAAEFPGSGIGLATVARIVRRHGGKAWAEGRVGEGATFYFSLG
ncbi:MAG: PAS domain S-box protein [Burkholderiales bacterium]